MRVLVILALTLAACGGSPTPTPAGTPAVTVEISATNNVFDRNELSVIADAPFAVRFQNNDVVPHNVAVRGGATPLVGEIFTGPAERTYFFPQLPQGSYTFVCDVHPEMKSAFLSN
ncbi:MAG: cupredoxin domain-containing protein [Candidatus Limnocylindrales bacterium]